MQSEVRPKQVKLLQKFQNSTKIKTYQVVRAISEHYKDVRQVSSNQSIKTCRPTFEEAGSIQKMGYGRRKKDMVTEESVWQAVVTNGRKFYFVSNYLCG